MRTREGYIEVVGATAAAGGDLTATTRLDGVALARDGSVLVAFENDGVFRLEGGSQARVMGDGEHTDYNRDEGVGGQVFYAGRYKNSLTLGSDGSLYVCDGDNQTIRIIDW